MNTSQQKLTLRGQIVGMRNSGSSVCSISRQLGICRSTVRKWLQRWEESGNLLDLPRCGGPRKTTAEQDRRIVDEIRRTPICNAVLVQRNLELDVCTRTVRRRLHESGYHHRTPAVKEKLEERHRDARLQFAQRFAHEDLAFWGRVIFSDEKTFLSTTHGRLRCWRVNGTRYSRQNIYEVARSGHVTCNMWGWMHLYGIGELAEIEGRFTANQYLEILEEVMLPTVRAMALPYPERIVFMQVRLFHTNIMIHNIMNTFNLTINFIYCSDRQWFCIFL